ncbi:MAG: GatB/YqeY domain-containing protein [Solirubrobacterales bacterium]
MSVEEQLKSDLATAMKAGEKERVGALRMVLSELQKAAKDGSADELAVLRRERKRRLEAAEAYREAGRAELAATEQAEADLIEGYMPAEVPEEELREIVERAVRESGAESVRDMGRAMGVAMAAVDGRADGKRVSGLVRAALGG